MSSKEQYEEILKGLINAGFLQDSEKYQIMHQEILKLNDKELRKLKREFSKLRKKHIKSQEDLDNFYSFVISSNPHP